MRISCFFLCKDTEKLSSVHEKACKKRQKGRIKHLFYQQFVILNEKCWEFWQSLCIFAPTNRYKWTFDELLSFFEQSLASITRKTPYICTVKSQKATSNDKNNYCKP